MLAALTLPGFLLGSTTQLTISRLTATSAVGGNTFTTASSWDSTPPTVSASVISKSGQYFAGFVKQNGTYVIYANATDGGSSPTGIATIQADVSALTTGQSAVPLVAGSYSVEGVTYGFRSAPLTVKNPLAAGSKSYSLTSTDNAGNAETQTGFAVTVDNTAPTGVNLQCLNGGATIGTVEAGDTCTFTVAETIDPESILAGWTGASTPVVFRMTDGGGNDSFTIWNGANTAQLNLGSVSTKGNYATTDLTAGASGTPSTMILDPTAHTITVTLGTIGGTVRHESMKNKAVWTTSGSAFDRAGNAMTVANVNESGGNDGDF